MPRKMKTELPKLQLVDDMTVGERVMTIRKNKELTQLQLSKKIGITRILLSNYETGRIRMFDEMITRIAIALEVSTDVLLGLKKIDNEY